jgi:hypothetical protein
LPAIHLEEERLAYRQERGGNGCGGILSHNLEVNLLHVHLLIELWRKLGRFQKLLIHGGRHGSWWVSTALCCRWWLLVVKSTRKRPEIQKPLVRARLDWTRLALYLHTVLKCRPTTLLLFPTFYHKYGRNTGTRETPRDKVRQHGKLYISYIKMLSIPVQTLFISQLP